MKIINRLLVRNALLSLAAAALLFASAATADAATLRVLSLRCIVPQERDSNGDELRLRVGASSLRFSGVRAGAVRSINRNFTFFGSVRVNLTEIDSFPSLTPRDENLGSHTVRETTLAARRTLRFNRHGSNYELTVLVIPVKRLRLELTSLECILTQERDSNGDELRLRISPDVGSRREFRIYGMRAGQKRSLNRRVRFDKRLTLNLTEIDSFPSLTPGDENLGTVSVGTTLGNRLARFNRHGAHYILRYRIVRE